MGLAEAGFAGLGGGGEDDEAVGGDDSRDEPLGAIRVDGAGVGGGLEWTDGDGHISIGVGERFCQPLLVRGQVVGWWWPGRWGRGAMLGWIRPISRLWREGGAAAGGDGDVVVLSRAANVAQI